MPATLNYRQVNSGSLKKYFRKLYGNGKINGTKTYPPFLQAVFGPGLALVPSRPQACWMYVVCCLLFMCHRYSHASLDFKYHRTDFLETFLKDVHANFSSITHLYSIGKSVEGGACILPSEMYGCWRLVNGTSWKTINLVTLGNWSVEHGVLVQYAHFQGDDT